MSRNEEPGEQDTPAVGAGKPGRERKPTSEKQVAANRRNAKLSTGPGPGGKKRSSRNATKAGYWAREVKPINDGPFMEQPEDFWERVQEIIEGLAPRDTLEYLLAKRAAGALVRLERTDRYEAALLRQAEDIDEVSKSFLADPKTFADEAFRVSWVIRHLDCLTGRMEPDEPAPLWGSSDLRGK